MHAPNYDDQYVGQLFDRMGPSYDLVNRVSSFGFCEMWRYQCVRSVPITTVAVVCDMMSGSGECWPYILPHKPARIVSVDFSPVMTQRQAKRLGARNLPVVIQCENATCTTLDSGSVDFVVGAFGLKTLSRSGLAAFAREIQRVLKPVGQFSLLEISDPSGWTLAPLYRWYVSRIIPWIGRLLLGDMECYRMLGVYTEAFGSCERVAELFQQAELNVATRKHFFGCATALVGSKPNAEEPNSRLSPR